ncbi:MAG: SdrD B-like domain-containing protein, partial [Clostridia bacterium]|nr:SdrD B-like domain-containing protein [Clostridia bacterium]
PDNPKEGNYRISGIVWEDENKDGIRDTQEKVLENITVKLFNKDTNSFVLENGVERTSITDNRGRYDFTKVSEGNYLIIFEYDSNEYSPTEYQKKGISDIKNSDAIEVKMENTNDMVGITDIIEVVDSDMLYIDLGLKRKEKFDLKLDKYIKKITVKNSKGNQIREYEETKTQKIEIPKKSIQNSLVIVEYSIKVTNVGEIPGYVKSVVDYIPEDMKFNTELNPNWYQRGDGNLYSTALGNEMIKNNESKEITLVLTKTVTEENLGLSINRASIHQTYNEWAIKENMDETNNISNAELIITVKTGFVAYSLIVILVGGIIIGGIYFIKRKVLEEK